MLNELIIYLLVVNFGWFSTVTSSNSSVTKAAAEDKPFTYSLENIADLIETPGEKFAVTWFENLPTDDTEKADFMLKTSKKTLKSAEKKYLPQSTKVVSYSVYGKRYRTLGTSKNYLVKGIASWYGPGFHHRTTSSGERYNMFRMTAAHKTLPLSTYVQVTNLINGRRVIVKINDRGPFVGNRVIDLSYAAAKQLRMVGLGIAPVRIKALG